MSSVDPSLFDDLQARGLVAQTTGAGEFQNFLKEARTLYCGFDPTASSLHIGSLVPLLTLKRFQRAGHKPIALVGGATGLIGDPSFKAQERSLNSKEVVAEWVDCLKRQISRFVDFDTGANSAEVVNNLDWVGPMDVLTFLRDIGKHFSINNMINKESVKQRIDREGEGISYTEFSYMILQSLDYAELYKRHNCTLQIGGSDQWGNITGGVDLVRRLHGGTAHGLTLPLVTKADGTKFGKTESGTIWLDPARTSPYAFHQFWLNTADADVYKFLRYFTFLPPAEIDGIEAADRSAGGKPQAQGILAREVTELVHGQSGLEAAERITRALFESRLESLTEGDLEQLKLDGIPSSALPEGDLNATPLTQLLADAGLAASGKQVKDALQRSAVSVNGRAASFDENMEAAQVFAVEKSYFGRFFIVRMGKKKYHLFERTKA
ncbi:tyrosine--tRNA ligase [Gilvimarinus sp. F26214L]|uniref:tyrosine--tRNA ligase n=1 Tax=Gilvimarinus sp. DZF01 TaxID=3461371 RepID=UPI0040459DBB